MNYLIELLKYFKGFFVSQADSCDITIVRRYETPTGFNGEIYINGRQMGMSCDAFIKAVELFKLPLTIGFENGNRVLRTSEYVITKGDFTARIEPNRCLIGSATPSENEASLGRLIDAVEGFKYIRLSVLNRLLIES
jgi:hypothetical protein